MKSEEIFKCTAQIESASITIERGFILSCWLQLNYGGSGQGFGGYFFMLGKTSAHYESAKNFNAAGIYIMRILEIAGVESWNELKGKTIRVEKTDEWGSILRIGHIIKDDWFDPKEELNKKEQK